MNPALRIGKEPRDTIIRLACFIVLPFEVYYLFLNMQYNTYQAEYRTRQQQEVQLVKAKISETTSRLQLSVGNEKDKSFTGAGVKDPSLILQQLMEAGKMTTLRIPPLSSTGKGSALQKDPLRFSLIPPTSRLEYFLSHKADFWLLGYAVLIGSLFFLLLQHVLKQQASLAYGAHIGQLTEEWETYRTELKAQHSFQRQLIQRFREASHAVHKILTRLDSSDPLTSDDTDTLIYGATTLSEGVSQGIPNYRREPICLVKLLNQVKAQVSHKMREMKISWDVFCSEDMTLIGDELFVKQILLNALAYPLYHTPKGAKVSITVTQENGFICIEAQDARFILTPSVKARLILPEGFIEENTLRQICAQNQIRYESARTSKGMTRIKILFPETPEKPHPFPFEPSINQTIH